MREKIARCTRRYCILVLGRDGEFFIFSVGARGIHALLVVLLNQCYMFLDSRPLQAEHAEMGTGGSLASSVCV